LDAYWDQYGYFGDEWSDAWKELRVSRFAKDVAWRGVNGIAVRKHWIVVPTSRDFSRRRGIFLDIHQPRKRHVDVSFPHSSTMCGVCCSRRCTVAVAPRPQSPPTPIHPPLPSTLRFCEVIPAAVPSPASSAPTMTSLKMTRRSMPVKINTWVRAPTTETTTWITANPKTPKSTTDIPPYRNRLPTDLRLAINTDARPRQYSSRALQGEIDRREQRQQRALKRFYERSFSGASPIGDLK